jgi:bifunctional UDP-N-acetylglucosamine pyrophosphorylase/glucosamine-1-phosphate N-acetyltransferase
LVKAPAAKSRRSGGRIPWRRLADELGVDLTPRLRRALRRLIDERGLSVAVEEAQRALLHADTAAEGRLQACLQFMLSGVTIIDPATTYIEERTRISPGTVIYPNTTITGRTTIGEGCHIGPSAIVIDCRIDDRCRVVASLLEGASLEAGVDVGPFSHLRPGAYLETGVQVGNFVEVKGSRLGRDSHAGHFSYIGDASVGAEVNVGAGTITCNFDGTRKHRTVIGDGAFIGSDTMLVAPVTVGEGAKTGAGAVVTKDVPPRGVVAGVPARPLTDRRRRGTPRKARD